MAGDEQITDKLLKGYKLGDTTSYLTGTLRVWSEPFTTLRIPKILNLRLDPYERAVITSKLTLGHRKSIT